jgi:aminoglycoside phosphotransferase (APT) family kinase protein
MIKSVVEQFKVDGEFVDAALYGSGHINDTYLVRLLQKDRTVTYILQRINHLVFHNPPKMMENMTRVTQHIHRKLLERQTPVLHRHVLSIIPTHDNVSYYQDPDGNYWRALNYIENSGTIDTIQSNDQAFQVARAFGSFIEMLDDFPGPPLHETIPDFHNGPKRLDDFRNVLESDPHNRAINAKEEIGFVLAHASLLDVLPGLIKEGKIHVRVTHNDTKVNNVLIDKSTGEGLCVIDLDTVMPGLSLYDFGDLGRSVLSRSSEDETDLGKVSMQMPRFEAILKGFLSGAGRILIPVEREYLVFSIKMITFLIGIRFLADHLAGDIYFRIHRENHNLDRCRTQFKLVRSVIEHEEEMYKRLIEYVNLYH